MQPHYLAPHLLYKPPKTVCEFSLCLFLHPNPLHGLEAHSHFSLLPEGHWDLLQTSGLTLACFLSDRLSLPLAVRESVGHPPGWSTFLPCITTTPSPALNSGHLPTSDFHKWRLWRKKGTLFHWKVVCSDEWWQYWDTGRSHISVFKCPDGAFHGGNCALLVQTHSFPDTPLASSRLSAFTFLAKSIQNNAFYIFLSRLNSGN